MGGRGASRRRGEPADAAEPAGAAGRAARRPGRDSGRVLGACAPVDGAAAGPSAVPGPAAPTAAGCAADVAPAPLPGWARSGFSPPDQAVPFVLGERGTILGVLFGQPFSAPAAPDRGNKILWVTRDPHPAGPLDDHRGPRRRRYHLGGA